MSVAGAPVWKRGVRAKCVRILIWPLTPVGFIVDRPRRPMCTLPRSA
jgi:hypothetical protein